VDVVIVAVDQEVGLVELIDGGDTFYDSGQKQTQPAYLDRGVPDL
jgi:hypothetical protein